MRSVFDMAQARIKAVERTDRIIARQREQAEELSQLRKQMSKTLLNGTSDLFAAVHRYEGELIRAALRVSEKSPCRAAALLGVSYQSLVAKIASQHPELMEERSPVYKRKAS